MTKTEDIIELCDDMICFDEDKVRRLIGQIPDMMDLAQLFKVLADENRVKIVYALSKEELCVCDIATILGLSVSNVSHHLRQLRTTRLVKYRKEGKQVYYSLDDEHVLNIINQGFDHINHIDKIS